MVIIMIRKPTYEELEQKKTENKKTKEILKLFKESVDNSSDAIGMSTPEGRHYYQNKVFDQMFGNVGETPPETLYVNQDIGEEVFSAIKLGKQWTGEVKMYSKDKTIRDIFLRAYANKDEYGNVTALVGIHTDITERMQAEEKLRNSELKHKTLVKNIPGMVYRAYPDWSAEIISGSEIISGYTEKELNTKDKNWLSIIHHDDIESAFKKGSKLTRAQKNLIHRYRIYTKKGYVRWVEDRKSSIFSDKGDFICIDGIVFDITDSKKAEEGREKILKSLQEALENVKTLSGLVPICANCKKIRDDKGYWKQIEAHIEQHSNAKFSHGICPECSEELYSDKDWYIKMKKKKKKKE